MVAIDSTDNTPLIALTEAEQRYLDHYIELDRLKLERQERAGFDAPRGRKG